MATKWKSNVCTSLASPLLHKWKSMALMGRKGKWNIHDFILIPLVLFCVFSSCREMKTSLFLFNLLSSLFTRSTEKNTTSNVRVLPLTILVCQQKCTHKSILLAHVHRASKPHCALQCGESFCLAGERQEMGFERWEISWAYNFSFCASDPTLTKVRKSVSSSFSRLWNRL